MNVAWYVAPETGVTNPIGVLKWFYGTNATTPRDTLAPTIELVDPLAQVLELFQNLLNLPLEIIF